MDGRFLYAGLIRLHLLHHAAQEPIYGLAMMKKLGRHGYRLSAGTLYPIPQGLEAGGYLTSAKCRLGKTLRRIHRATPAGRRVLKSAKLKVSEPFGEMFEDGVKGHNRAMRRIGESGAESQS
jgi:PadR family transcriptional regulator PadR